MKTTHFEAPLRSLGLLKLVLQKTAKQHDDMDGHFGYKKMSLKDFISWWKGVLEKKTLPKAVISLDEFAGKVSLFFKEEDKRLMILARSLFCCTGIPVMIMGTDVTAVSNEAPLDNAGSAVDDELPWCYVVSKLPKPTKNSILEYAECFQKFQMLPPCWTGFTEYMGLREGHDFPSVRPFVMDWAFEYIHENIDSIVRGKVTPFKFLASMIDLLKRKLFYSKHHLSHSDGIAGQFSTYFPMFRDGTWDVPAVLINCHYALLKNSDEDASDEPLLPLSRSHNWIPKASFPAYDQDSLLNFMLNTWKNRQAFSFGIVPDVAEKFSTFSAAGHYFKLFHTSDVGTFVFEHMFHVATVVASQRGRLTGSTLSEFLPRFLQEIDDAFKRSELDARSKKILDSFKVRIPFYPSISAELPVSLKSIDGLCSGRYDILPDSDQAEGIGQLSNGGILYLECKNWKCIVDNAGYIEMIRKPICAFEKCKSRFNLHLCWVNEANISQLTAQEICANHGEDIRNYIDNRKLYRQEERYYIA